MSQIGPTLCHRKVLVRVMSWSYVVSQIGPTLCLTLVLCCVTGSVRGLNHFQHRKYLDLASFRVHFAWNSHYFGRINPQHLTCIVLNHSPTTCCKMNLIKSWSYLYISYRIVWGHDHPQFAVRPFLMHGR